MSLHSYQSPCNQRWFIIYRVDSRFASSQWETVLLCNDVSHWLGASLESVLIYKTAGLTYTQLLVSETCCLFFWEKKYHLPCRSHFAAMGDELSWLFMRLSSTSINILGLWQNGCYFADGILICIFMKGNFAFSFKCHCRMSLKVNWW